MFINNNNANHLKLNYAYFSYNSFFFRIFREQACPNFRKELLETEIQSVVYCVGANNFAFSASKYYSSEDFEAVGVECLILVYFNFALDFFIALFENDFAKLFLGVSLDFFYNTHVLFQAPELYLWLHELD